jgi:hypothetical protein
MNHQINLELLNFRAFKNGTLMVSYRVKHPTGATKKSTAKPARSAKKGKN